MLEKGWDSVAEHRFGNPKHLQFKTLRWKVM